MARRGEVQNIVVKDLSRWGRNYPEVIMYLDQVFPLLGLRFISINDRYDSADYIGQTAPVNIAFSSIVHDIYNKELSFKVSQSQRIKAERGEYVCGTAPYGFVRSNTEKNRLVVDEEAAAVIRRIFDMACEGLSAAKIAEALNADGVNSPSEHRRKHGRAPCGGRALSSKAKWGGGRISKIISDERYIGTMVFGKTKRTADMHGRMRDVRLPEDKWVRVAGAHEAIIEVEQFNKANGIRE